MLKRAIEKYGEENFIRDSLDYAFSFDEARMKEEFYIAKFDSTSRERGYNITSYSWGGQPITDGARRKIAEKLTGRKLSEETKQKMSKPKGERSQEHRMNHSKAIRGRQWIFEPITGRSKLVSKNEKILEGWKRGRPISHMVNSHTEEANVKRSLKLRGRQNENPC